jgi:hypothetical protein
VVIFNISSAEIKTKSADVLLKMTTILKELRIAQQRSKKKQTLAAADLFGDERKHPRFIHFTHLQQRSASAW